MGRRLKLAEMFLAGMIEVLRMHTQYFRDLNEKGKEIARQMDLLIEQGNDAVGSESYRSARTALRNKMEIEAAKKLVKARIEKAYGSRGDGASGYAGEELRRKAARDGDGWMMEGKSHCGGRTPGGWMRGGLCWDVRSMWRGRFGLAFEI